MLLTACSDGGYYLQAAKGHYEILKQRQPIEELLNDRSLPPKQHEQLANILEIRSFATARLFLPDNNSYRSYVELDRPYPVWNVVAAPALSLQPINWCFPITGCISYRGYFSETEARSFADKLQKENYDTLVAGVPAYSTLSWFDDPVLSSFSHWPATSVARLIFHELAHQQLYLPGDSAFSEAFATSVEIAGTRHWLKTHGSAQDQASFQRKLERETTFVEWANSLRLQLSKLYDSAASEKDKLAGKKKLLIEARQSYQKLRDSWNGYSGYDKWVATLNNARLASLQTYRKLLPAFDALLKQNDFDFAAFYKSCEALSTKPIDQRRKILAKLGRTPALAAQEPQ